MAETIYRPARPDNSHTGPVRVCWLGADIDRKLGAAVPLWGEGELGPDLTQCGQGQGLPQLPARQVSSIQVFGHNTPTLWAGQLSDSLGRTA